MLILGFTNMQSTRASFSVNSRKGTVVILVVVSLLVCMDAVKGKVNGVVGRGKNEVFLGIF